VKKSMRFLGLDVHAETIVVALAEASGEVRFLGTVPNRVEAVRRMVRKLGAVEQLKACYEAGPCGYVLYWQLTQLGVPCAVVAPSLIPVKAGDRVKTDRRDAENLARGLRSGDLTAVWVPDAAHEALRDLVRARLAAKRDQLRHRHRLGKFLLRHGLRRPAETKAWTQRHLRWLQKEVVFDQPAQESVLLDYLGEVQRIEERLARLERAIDEAVQKAPQAMREVIDALQALRGIAKVSAVTIVAELGQISRFRHATQLMSYGGMVPSEHSSGERVRRGGITKTGNAHLRRIVVEAAWSYRHRPAIGPTLRGRQENLSDEVKATAWKAQHRLHHRRYRVLLRKGKSKQQVVTAVGRELLGFIWAIGVTAERKEQGPQQQRAA
jgi:transposase